MDPQLKAIETIDRNLAVNAGAGTGKTKVLTERFINILEHGNLVENHEIESIVAITFTKKATEEMTERIRSLIKSNFSKGLVWTRYYRDMEKANISTIHSFCAKMLRENPVEANIDPLFEVMEDYTSKELLNKSIDKVLNDYLENSDLLYKILMNFGVNRISKIYDDFVSLYNSIRTVGLSFQEVKEITMNNLEGLNINEDDIEYIKSSVLYLMDKVTKNSKIYKLQDNQIWIRFKDNDYVGDELFLCLETIKNNLGKNKNEQETINKLNETIDRLLMAKDGNYKEYYEAISDILIEIDTTYSNEKKKIGGLDYDDLQIKVLNLLDNQKILKKYQDKYKYIMIDEFQDTNELQKKIFYKLSTDKKPLDRDNLFVVGDPKQSIYAFRGADIDVFYQVLDDIGSISKENIITLEKNYRSVDTVLNFINNIFEKLMKNNYQKLEAVNKSKNEIDIEVLEDEDVGGGEEGTVFEAEMIAKRIKQIVDNSEFEYKEIALLFRSTTRNFYYEEALKKYNIPFHNSSSKRYFYRSEILDIINGLKAISNPYDSISMIGFLRGPMIGVSDQTIFYLLSNMEKNIYETINKVLEINIEDKEKLKLENAHKLLTYFYSVKDVSTISYLLNQLIERTCFLELQILEEHGKQSLSNINKFINMAEHFDIMDNKSLESFIDYMEKLRSQDTSEGAISSENAVNLLTIHKSKGLQFPVVIIPELSKGAPSRYPKFLFNKNIGLGIRFEDCKGIYNEIKSIEDKKSNEEKKRIIYVAMTRAKNKLILGNIGKDSGYKKMIKDFLDLDHCHKIDSIDIESCKDTKKLKLIDTIKDQDLNLHESPNLRDLNDHIKTRFKRFSISQFLMYKTCKRKFYFKYINKLDLPSVKDDNIDSQQLISGIDKGNIIHEFCQHYDETKEALPLLKDISQSYGIVFNDLLSKELKPYIDNYKKYYKNEYKNTYIEKPFTIRIHNYHMAGVIDRINISNEGIEIVDIKTNKLYNKSKLIEQYTPQLRLYAYVVERILQKKVNKATILFLENGEEVNINISKENTDDTISQLKDFFLFVENNRTMNSYNKSDDCSRCEYNKFCNNN